MASARAQYHPPKSACSPAEWRARVELAAVFRLVAAHGWDDGVATHISARVPGAESQFLINPMGWYFEEITASSLIKVGLDGMVIDRTDTTINAAGFTIHSAIHTARDDAHCVIHLHAESSMAVSAQATGLLPLTQHAMMIHADLAYHEFEGIALDLSEREGLVRDLGERNLMILRNHGSLVVGGTCADAWTRAYALERACAVQIKATSSGAKLHYPPFGIPERVTGQAQAMGSLGRFGWDGALRWLDRRDPSFRN